MARSVHTKEEEKIGIPKQSYTNRRERMRDR
jgi:hypothetical protein